MMGFGDRVRLVGDVGDDVVGDFLGRVRPCLEVRSGWFREVCLEGVDLRGSSFVWDPKLVGPEFTCGSLGRCRVPSFHSFVVPVLFKPSVVECVASVLRFVEDLEGFEFFCVDCGLGFWSVVGSCHMSWVTLLAGVEVGGGVVLGGVSGV